MARLSHIVMWLQLGRCARGVCSAGQRGEDVVTHRGSQVAQVSNDVGVTQLQAGSRSNIFP